MFVRKIELHESGYIKKKQIKFFFFFPNGSCASLMILKKKTLDN